MSKKLNVSGSSFADEDLNSDHPKFLYRGMKFKSEDYADYDFENGLSLPKDYIINETGMKCVIDGNEYGVYMSSNEQMALNYAMPSRYDTSFIAGRMYIGSDRAPLGMPSVGVLTVVDTTGLDIKEPYISPVMQGHYNNGYQGKEWISTSSVPSDNVAYAKMMVGPDLLYDSVEFADVSASDMKDLIDDEMSRRKESLMKMYDFLKDESSNDLLRLDYNLCRDSFKQIFVEGCLDRTSFNLSSMDGLRAAMLHEVNNKEGGITLKDIRKISRDMSMLSERDISERSQAYESLIESYFGEDNKSSRRDILMNKYKDSFTASNEILSKARGAETGFSFG